MEAELIWTAPASEDLNSVFEYLQETSPLYGSKLADDIIEAAQSLPRFPYRGRIVPEIGDPSIRELFVDNYRVLYHRSEIKISVLSIVHMSRDFSSFWKQIGL